MNEILVEVLKDEKRFFELRGEWSELLAKDLNATVFQSWDFLYPNWKYRKNGRLLYVITLRSKDGKLQAIAPFWIQIVKKGITLKMIEFVGTRGLDYLDFIVSREVDRKKVIKDILTYVLNNKNDWNIISLSELREKSKDFLNGVFEKLKVNYSFSKCSTCVKINLPETWEDYKKSLGSSTRKDLNYDENRFDKAFDVDFLVYTENSSQLQMMLASLQKIHQSRWKNTGVKGSFHEEWMQDLDKDIVISCAEKGILRYFILLVDGIPVAGLSGFSFDSTIYTHTMSISIDEKYRKFSIGNVLLQKAIKWSIENGYKFFDLSRGNEQYKFKFGGKAEDNYRFEIYKNVMWKGIFNLGRNIYGLK